MSNAVLSVPGEQVTKTYGRYQITAQQTVDGGYAINTFTATGGTRIPELCFSTPDRDTYRLAYSVIREGGINNVHPDGVRQALTDALTRDLWEVERRRDSHSVNRVEHINNLLDRLDTPEVKAEAAELGDAVRRFLACDHPRIQMYRPEVVDSQYTIRTVIDGRPHLSFTSVDVDSIGVIEKAVRVHAEKGGSPDGVQGAIVKALSRALREMLHLRDGNCVTRLYSMAPFQRVGHLVALLGQLGVSEQDAVAAVTPQALTDMVPGGQKMQISPSRTGVERKPLSPVMQRAVNANLCGIVYPGDGIRAATLRALAGRGLGRLHYDGNRKRIVSLELNKQGLNAVKAVAA